MSNDLILVAIIALGLVVTAVMLGGRGGPEPALAVPAQPIKLTAHGNSALAGGYIDGDRVRFYVPSPVQMLRDRLPGLELVDCTQNGLALTEALRGGPVRMDNPALGGTVGTCEALADIWRRERPAWAYVALLEVEPLFWPDFTLAQLPDLLDELLHTAQRCAVRLVLQGPIHFAAVGPVTAERLRLLAAADLLASSWAQANGVPYVSLADVPFDPAHDVCADNLHPTMAMHQRYADERARQLRALLAPQAAQHFWEVA